MWSFMHQPGRRGSRQEARRPGQAGPCDRGHVSFAEEAVNEVKRQAMSELQKAVSDAERKAHELISTERAKMERALAEARRQASEDALTVINQQEDSSEVGAHPAPHTPPQVHVQGSLPPGRPMSSQGLLTSHVLARWVGPVAVLTGRVGTEGSRGEVHCPGKWQGLYLQPGVQTPKLMLSNWREQEARGGCRPPTSHGI